jgi:hypothetical protein
MPARFLAEQLEVFQRRYDEAYMGSQNTFQFRSVQRATSGGIHARN